MECHLSTRVKGECDVCGTVPARLHMPLDVHGWYCERCCPVCKPASKAQQQQQPAEEQEPQPAAA